MRRSPASMTSKRMQTGKAICNGSVKFFDAEAFMATYRDQTEPGTTESFAEEIFEAIEPSLAHRGSGLSRLTTALTVAGGASP